MINMRACHLSPRKSFGKKSIFVLVNGSTLFVLVNGSTRSRPSRLEFSFEKERGPEYRKRGSEEAKLVCENPKSSMDYCDCRFFSFAVLRLFLDRRRSESSYRPKTTNLSFFHKDARLHLGRVCRTLPLYILLFFKCWYNQNQKFKSMSESPEAALLVPSSILRLAQFCPSLVI
jgi:hypothetical protein